MNFVRTHLTKHHFRHSPHRWILALLLSPIHAGELRYMSHYHLRFVHARKLFVFDLLLSTSIFLLIATVITFFLYDPSVIKDVNMTLVASTHTNNEPVTRIKSGEHMTYTAQFENTSDVHLTHVSLSFRLPKGFVLDQDGAIPASRFHASSSKFVLDDLVPGASGEASVTGLFVGTPDEEDVMIAELSYQQNGKNTTEIRPVHIITTLRGSVLDATMTDTPTHIFSSGSIDATLTLTNLYHHPIENIRVPLSSTYLTVIATKSPTIGYINKETWFVERLDPNETARVHTTWSAHIDRGVKEIVFSITPTREVNGIAFPQTPMTQTLTVLRPEVQMSVEWLNDERYVKPGETISARMTLKNTGNIPLKRLSLSIPAPSTVINESQMAQYNKGKYANNTFSINDASYQAFTLLKPGESTTIDITLPILSAPRGTQNLTYTLHPHIQAFTDLLPGVPYQSSVESTPITIDSALILNATLRYFTVDGDQLGRGPLPPKVGEETKYWAFLEIQNTTNEVRNVAISAQLSPKASATGRSSVSKGNDIVFDTQTKSIRWTSSSLAPQEHAGVYLELSYTPSPNDIGTIQTLLSNIIATGQDTFTNNDITGTGVSLTTALDGDVIGNTRGTIVLP